MGVNHNPVAMITALPWLADSHAFCAVRHEPAVTLASTVFSVRYEMWLKGGLNMGRVVQHNTSRGQHSDDGINAWFPQRLKKRRMKESVD
jgi:hypothetical protein